MKRGTNHYLVDGTANEIYYPLATGGSTATSASSALLNARNTRVAGILVTAAHTAATTITIYTDNGADGGSAVPGLVFTIAASQACPFPIPLGDCDGVKIPGALGVATSNAATKCIVFYDKIS